MAKSVQFKKITAVVVPPGEVVVVALDEDGGLWKWDSGMKSDEWVQVCNPPRK